MIQRIQTLYLLTVTVLQTILFFSSIAKIPVEGGETIIYNTLDYWAMAVLTGVTVLIAFFSIFLYRKRILQIRVCIYNAILLLALQAYLVYYLVSLTRKVEAISYSIPVMFPIVSVILIFLTIRNIGKDEALIKALDRIR